MKHIGWCLDNIQIAMMDMPKELTSEESKKKAKQVIDDVQKYADTLVDLIRNPEFKKTIHKLEQAPIEGIRLQAHEVEELFKDLEHALHVIDLTLTELREILALKFHDEKDIRRWKRSYDKLVLMIDQKFGGERGELRKEFQINLHTKEQLQDIVNSEKHLAEFLK